MRKLRSCCFSLVLIDFDGLGFGQIKDYFASCKKQVAFSVAIGNEKLKHECFPKHSRMGISRMKSDKETEEGKKRRVSMERSTAGTKKISPDGFSVSKQNTILIKIICYYFRRYGKIEMKFN